MKRANKKDRSSKSKGDEATGENPSKLLAFLKDKPRVSKAVQRYVISTSSENATKDAGQWHFRSLFVIEATMVNVSIMFFLLFFWVINRQTHLRPTRGSVITRKSDTPTDDESSVTTSDGEGEEEGLEISTKRRKSRKQQQIRSSLESLVSYGIEDDDDDDGYADELIETQDNENLPWSRQLKDLIRIGKTLWYLNEQALTMCARSAEYKTYAKDEEIFSPESYDGTLFMVIKGSVEVTFCEFHMPDDQMTFEDESSEGSANKQFTVTTGSDKPVTSFLALFWGMIQKFNADSTTKQKERYPFAVRARATSDDTELIQIPPDCFARILKEYPVDVFRIIGTILNRLQRITVQTLVKTLGLRKELLPRLIQQPYEKDYVASELWKQFHLSLNNSKESNFCDERDLKEMAVLLFRMRMGIPAEMDCESLNLLRDFAELVVLDGSQQTTLIESGSKHDSCYLLLEGNMELGIYIPNGPENWTFYRNQVINPGALLGEHECFTGEVSLSVVRSFSTSPTVNCVLLKIPKHVYTTLIVRYPRAMARSLDSLLNQISPAVDLLNWTSDWQNVKAADNVTRRGTMCDSLYVVLNGRLRARKRGANQAAPEEYGRGKVVGEIGILTGASWPFDVYAIRHSEIAKVPVETLLAIIRAFPKAGLNFARSIAAQVQASSPQQLDMNYRRAGKVSIPYHPSNIPESMVTPGNRNISKTIMPSYGLNLASIAVVPMDSTGIDLDKFCSTLVSGFSRIAPSKLLTKDLIRKTLGSHHQRHKNSAMHELRMVRMLADMEENNRLVVYQADPKYTWWTRLCIQQADCILLVVNSDRAPHGKRLEQSLAWAYDSMDVRIDLVVIGQNHQPPMSKSEDDDSDFDCEEDKDEGINVSDQLNNWSEQRKWISGHHLVRAPIGCHKQDFHRMCRRVTGRAVGLVLGAGGARGLAHLGVIKALKEAGVTIDLVGGTSQGSFVGALYAQQPDDIDAVFSETRKMAKEMSNMKSKLFDLTLPMTSIFSGYMFNRGIRKRLGNLRIQDLVLNFFCNSVDLQKQKEIIHTKGLLWKYVRASMSMTGYLPPIAEDGQLLVDGAYMNAVPTDIMKYQMGARVVIAVETSAEIERDHYMYGNSLSGWWVLWNSLNPFSKTVKVPSMGDISDLLVWASSGKHLRNSQLISDLYLMPPVKDFGTLEYEKIDEIIEKSYVYCKPIIDDFVKTNPWLVSSKQNTSVKMNGGTRVAIESTDK